MTSPAPKEEVAPLSPLGKFAELRNKRVWIFSTMLFSAVVSLIASFVLAVDAIALAANPDSDLSCNINAAISCGAVGNSWQAALFGFPNAFLGLMAETVVITIAVASLGGVRFPRWFMFSAQIVYTLGLIFAYWLFSQSMLVIGALCPWCLLVTLSTTLVFMSLTHFNALEDNLYLPKRFSEPLKRFMTRGWDTWVVVYWLTFIVSLIILKYGETLFSL